MTHAAPGEGSPVDNPNFTPAEQPYEPNQGTGDAERPQEEVDAEQLKLVAPSDAAPRTDTDGKAIPPEPAEDEKPKRKAGRHRKE
jgi:hypothetical protein